MAYYFYDKYLSSIPLRVKNNIITTQSPVCADVVDELKSEKPKGEFIDMSISVTSSITELYDEARHKLPWKSFDLYNSGPNPVYVSVNNWNWPQAPIPVGNTINIDFQKSGAIKKLYLKCDTGESATVSLFIVK